MINQFSAHYDEVEDRILLRFNTKDMQEFRLWLSRKVVLEFLPVLPPKTEQGSEIKEELKKQTDASRPRGSEGAKKVDPYFQKPKFVKGKNFPIGENPELVKLIKTELKGGLYKCHFELKVSKSVNVPITPEMLLKLHSLVSVMAEKAGWLENNKIEEVLIPKGALH